MGYTSGPWIAKKYDDGCWGVRQDPQSAPSVILGDEALCLGFSICNVVDNGEADEGNAHLIAAAPEMVEAHEQNMIDITEMHRAMGRKESE